MSVVDVRLPVMTTSVLDREMFSEAEASRLLRVPQSTLHWWLEGGTYRNRRYRPVIRLEPRGERSVTWAEFVESGLLREHRRTHGVALSELRTVIDRLRDEYGTPYPLAHHRPFVGPGRELLLEVQRDAGSIRTSVLLLWRTTNSCSHQPQTPLFSEWGGLRTSP
jgi:hypothetical protein